MFEVASFLHIFVTAAAVASLILSIAAIPKIIDSQTMSTGVKTYWIAVIFLVPILGLLVWWFSARKRG